MSYLKKSKHTNRAPNGQFTGEGLRPFTGSTSQTSVPIALNEARMKTALDIQQALDTCAAWDSEDLPPVVVIKSDPGLGKSRMMREKLAVPDNFRRIVGDVHFYSPTLALSDEAADHAKMLGLPHAVTRGRLAKNPVTGDPMCDRPAEVERVGKLGQPIKLTLCEALDADGKNRRCPHFFRCSYRLQFENLASSQIVRFEAHNYLTLPNTAEGRKIGLRIIDETSWKAMGLSATLPIHALSSARSLGVCKEGPEKDARAMIIFDLLGCVKKIAADLRQGRTVMQAIADYSADRLAEFAKAEKWSDHRLSFFPDASAKTIADRLTVREAKVQQVAAKVQFWTILEKAKLGGVQDLQSLQFIAGSKFEKTGNTYDVIKVFWHLLPPRDAPVIILDADADSTLMEPFFPNHVLHETRVMPNADITYIADKTFSKSVMMRKTPRDEWRSVIEVERLQDDGGGVLVIATKAVVKAFFTDHKYDFSEMDDTEASEFMMDTQLLGVKWTWFGSRTLGSNRWKNCTTCIVIGREEWPPEALEAEARKMWGHGLKLIEHDETGNCILPEVETLFPMTDGKTYSIKVRAHPDPRIRAIQTQARECATRQGAERLRLASATERKRVIIGSKIPIQGLPATRALLWAEYLPSRSEAALAEAKGALRLSPKGLANDAPLSFQTEKSAERYAAKNDLAGFFFGPHTTNSNIISGWGGKNLVLVAFKIKGVQGRMKTRAILVCDPDAAERIASAKWGELTGFEILQVAELASAPLSLPLRHTADGNVT